MNSCQAQGIYPWLVYILFYVIFSCHIYLIFLQEWFCTYRCCGKVILRFEFHLVNQILFLLLYRCGRRQARWEINHDVCGSISQALPKPSPLWNWWTGWGTSFLCYCLFTCEAVIQHVQFWAKCEKNIFVFFGIIPLIITIVKLLVQA